jgi:DNA-binding transcriptional regulator PaaX|tara:strand:+ start:644 stop:883 length:240 start_codon:yes stop_codon:yes gene_type:complete
MKKEPKQNQYVSRRIILNEEIKKALNMILKNASYKKFVGNLMNEFGVSERFIRDILTGYEFSGKIKVDKKKDKIMRLKK